MGKNKGHTYERKLRDLLINRDVPVLRIPASGSGTTQELPDLIAKPNGTMIAIEVKYTSSGSTYIQKEKLRELQYFSRLWDAIPCAFVRFSGDTDWYCLPLRGEEHTVYRTPKGNISLLESNKDRFYMMDEYLSLLPDTDCLWMSKG